MEKQKQKKLLLVLIPLLAVLLLCAFILLMQPGNAYSVSFCDVDGTVLESDRYAEGAKFELPEDPEKEGYRFNGWILEGEEELYDFTAENALKVQSDMKFIASFGKREYTVTFLRDNGIDVISSSTYRYNDEIAVPEDPEKEGHSFAGWILKGEASVYDFTAKGAKNAKDGMTFIAEFEAHKHKVVFMDADGKEYKAFTLKYGDNFVVPDEIEREGYAFDGWALEGETEAYDFEADSGTKVGDQDYVFVPLYTKLSRVMGRLVRLDGTEYSGKVTLCFGKNEKTITVDSGWFTVDIRPGYYPFKIKSTVYRCLPEEVTIKGQFKDMGDVTMIQALNQDYKWWNGATKTESGASATISTASNAHAESATEYKLGNDVTGASSWNIKSHIEAGATGRVGFSLGRNDAKNGTVYFYVDMNDGTAGFFTWSTNMETGLNANKYSQKLSDTVLEALKSADGYDLELKATNIDGKGTGWLTLYVNNTEVLRVYNNFVGVRSGGKGVNGQVMDLGNVHLSLAVMGTDAEAVFTNYMHQKNGVKALTEVQVTGKLVKADKTALADQVTLQCGSICRVADVAEDGTFTTKLPAGNYDAFVSMNGYWGACGDINLTSGTKDLGTITLLQNLREDYVWFDGASLSKEPGCAVLSTASGVNGESATEYGILPNISGAKSWRVTSHIEAGAAGIVGYSVGRNDGKNGTVFFYVNNANGNCGFFTWDTFSYSGPSQGINNYGTKGSIAASDAVKAALKESSGYDLTLTATNINGEGTGWLTLYVNDTAVLTMEASDFTGVSSGGKGVNGQKMNLGSGHLSLVVMGNQAKAAFKNYYTVVNAENDLQFGTVTGTCSKVDGTAGFPATVTLRSGTIYQEVAVAADGTFSAKLPVGTYTATGTLSGYRVASDAFDVTDGQNTNITIKLLQTLTQDYKWWGGATMTETGDGVTLSTASGVNANSATEYKIGNTITGATSWRASSHIEAGATGIVGFSVGRDDGNNGSVYFYVNNTNGNYGFFTWDTFKYSGTPQGINNYGTKGSGTASNEVKTAMKSAEGCDLTLTATNIDGEGTGWLTLYVNDKVVMTMYNNFVGVLAGGKGVNGQLMDLGNVHVSLAAMGTNISATFNDYYTKLNGETAKAAGTVNGKMVKVDGTALPATALLQFGDEYRNVKIAADGTFRTQLPVGTYTVSGTVNGYRAGADEFTVANGQTTNVTVKLLQTLTQDMKWWDGASMTETGDGVTLKTASGVNANSATEYKIGNTITGATSWRVSSHIETGATGIVGFSVGRDDGNNGTVYVYVNKNNNGCGFYTWGTFNYSGKIPNFNVWGANGSGATSAEVQAMLKSANGFDLTLTATNIDGEGTGWLTLYVNDTAVLTMYNNFTGVLSGGKGVKNQLMDLGNVHVSLAAMGTNISATFNDYYTKLNGETAKATGTVNGKLVKLDGTALPSTALLQFGDEYRNVKIAADGTFTTQLPAGTHTLSYTMSGYRTICDSITVTNGQTTDVTVKLLQALTTDHAWRGGATKTENGASATLKTASGVDPHSGTEYKIGNSLASATGWTAETYVEAGATGQVGFTVGRDDGNNGTIFFYMDMSNGQSGFFTWGTFKYTGSLTVRGDTSGSYTDTYSKGFNMSDAIKAALKSRYKLTLKATDITTQGTGTLTLYVNDMECLKMYASGFTGVLASGTDGKAGQKPDLANSHVSLAVKGINIGATFTDYYTTFTDDYVIPQDVYVSSTGNDGNFGTEQSPYATFGKALESVPENGTIHVVGTVAVPANFLWSAHGKSMTITGDTLDFTPMGNRVTIGDSVHFQNVTLKFDDKDYVFAAGNQVTIGENVTISSMINLFGGGNEVVVASTNLTVLSGNYYNIFGGGYKADVNGNVKLTVGGNTNASAGTPGDANDRYMIFGGNCYNTIHGSSSLTFTGNAIANYVFGGGAYGGNTVGGAATYVTGGRAMAVYGASYKVAQNFNIQLTITGGVLEQAFGGSLQAAHNGNVTMQILGGTISRRIYGGCYNDYTGSWKSANYVKGHISLTIGGGASIQLQGSDASIYARTRHSTVSATETSELIFADATAYNAYKDKLGAQDSIMKSIMGNVTAADKIVYSEG